MDRVAPSSDLPPIQVPSIKPKIAKRTTFAALSSIAVGGVAVKVLMVTPIMGIALGGAAMVTSLFIIYVKGSHEKAILENLDPKGLKVANDPNHPEQTAVLAALCLCLSRRDLTDQRDNIIRHIHDLKATCYLLNWLSLPKNEELFATIDISLFPQLDTFNLEKLGKEASWSVIQHARLTGNTTLVNKIDLLSILWVRSDVPLIRVCISHLIAIQMIDLLLPDEEKQEILNSEERLNRELSRVGLKLENQILHACDLTQRERVFLPFDEIKGLMQCVASRIFHQYAKLIERAKVPLDPIMAPELCRVDSQMFHRPDIRRVLKEAKLYARLLIPIRRCTGRIRSSLVTEKELEVYERAKAKSDYLHDNGKTTAQRHVIFSLSTINNSEQYASNAEIPNVLVQNLKKTVFRNDMIRALQKESCMLESQYGLLYQSSGQENKEYPINQLLSLPHEEFRHVIQEEYDPEMLLEYFHAAHPPSEKEAWHLLLTPTQQENYKLLITGGVPASL